MHEKYDYPVGHRRETTILLPSGKRLHALRAPKATNRTIPMFCQFPEACSPSTLRQYRFTPRGSHDEHCRCAMKVGKS
jgi:hypothetical protein